MKGVIIYKSKYGATQQYALWLSTALELPAWQPEEKTINELLNSDFFIIGSPIYG